MEALGAKIATDEAGAIDGIPDFSAHLVIQP
jgi:hypothetical protein